MNFSAPVHANRSASLEPLNLRDSLCWLFGFVRPGEVVLVKADAGEGPKPYFPVLFGDDHAAAIATVAAVVEAIIEHRMTPYLKLNPFSAEKIETYSGRALPREWTGDTPYRKGGLRLGTWSNSHISRITIISGDHDTGREGDENHLKAIPTDVGLDRFLNAVVAEGNVLTPTLVQVARGYSPVWVLSEPVAFDTRAVRDIKGITKEIRVRLGDSTGFIDTGVYSNVNPDIKAPGAIHPITRASTTYFVVDDGRTYTMPELQEHFDPSTFRTSDRLRKPQRILRSSAPTTRRSSSGGSGRHLAPSQAFVEDAQKLIVEWQHDLRGKVHDFVLAYSWHRRKIMMVERLPGLAPDAAKQVKKDILNDLIEEVLEITNACEHSTTIRKIKDLVKMPYPDRPRSVLELADAWGVTAEMVERLRLRTIVPTYVKVDRQHFEAEEKRQRKRERDRKTEHLRDLVLNGAPLAKVKAAGFSLDQMKRMRKALKREGISYPRVKGAVRYQ